LTIEVESSVDMLVTHEYLLTFTLELLGLTCPN